jgi:hypothetical protein
MALENGWFITTDDELLELRLGLIVPIDSLAGSKSDRQRPDAVMPIGSICRRCPPLWTASRSPSRRMIRPPSHFI